MIVADNSVVTELLVGSDQTLATAIARVLDGRPVVVPELLDLEAVSAIRRLARAGAIDDAVAGRAVRALADLPFERAPHAPLIPRIWELRDNVSPYDAAYVALAETLGASLLTTDARLSRAPGLRCTVELIS